jgi:hypothetical protein
VSFDRGVSASGPVPTVFTAADGSFVLLVPSDLREASTAAPALLVTGADGGEVLPDGLAGLQADGFLGSVRLSQRLGPLPLSLLGRLEALAQNGTYLTGQAPEHTQPGWPKSRPGGATGCRLHRRLRLGISTEAVG